MPCGSSKANSCGDQAEKNGENRHCAFQDLDHSVLQHPLHSGVRNVKQILKCMQNATKEVKDIILNECNIIYECKVCANLFRSLANFMYHKRCYCKNHLCEEMVLFDHFEEETTVVQPEAPQEKEVCPKLVKCTVDLVKADVGKEKTVLIANDEKKNNDIQSKHLGKGSKNKELEKKNAETNKPEHSMISRRTRDKNFQREEKKALTESKIPKEPPKKVRKVEEETTLENSVKEKIASQNIIKEKVNENITEEQIALKNTTEEKVANLAEDVSIEEDKIIENSIQPEKIEDDPPKEKITELDDSKNCNTADKDNLADTKKNLPMNVVLQPMKKIVFAKPKTIQLKNSAVLDNIRKNMKTDSVGLTKIVNANKNVQCFPKLILKTIDGNPHAVFQRTDEKKSDSINLKNPVVLNKTENEKVVLVLKKDSITSNEPFHSEEETKVESNCLKQTEFHHLTRRKRLIARNDCDVQQLKCLTCNTIFTSLKTLYFHMLSIHSKKRLYYPCPLCKALFVQMYGVTRHLVSIHNKTKEQINKMRESIKKKSVWKKVVDDISTSKDNLAVVDKPDVKEEMAIEIKPNQEVIKNDPTTPAIKTVIKLNKSVNLHHCSKCNRVFGRKSSQVSHEKFCIMNAIKVETVDLTTSPAPTSPPMISFLSFHQRKQNLEAETNKQAQSVKFPLSGEKVNIRPKRKAEKQMHKDFINSQTLKWRTVSKVPNTSKAVSTAKKSPPKNLAKKVTNIMNLDSLTCLKCGKTFSSCSNLKRHVAIHVGWTRFKCILCEYQAYNKSQCWFHVQKVHDISEDDVEKYIQNLGANWFSKNSVLNQSSKPQKNISTSNIKRNLKKAIPKLKINKKINVVMKTPEKKSQTSVKKDSLDLKKEIDVKKDKSLNSNHKKEVAETKKEKIPAPENKDPTAHKRERSSSIELKKGVKEEFRKERSHSLGPVLKCNVSVYKNDASNYKSVTTNNPTTIILSKKLPTSSVQSVVTIPTESLSSNLAKSFPLRSSPRKAETKSPEEKSPTSVVTRSTSCSKSPIQIKITPPRPSSAENVKKPFPVFTDKTYPRKEKLISEWFPKKDLNSNASRRESKPLIIGLVPASSSSLSIRSKNPAITYEKNS